MRSAPLTKRRDRAGRIALGVLVCSLAGGGWMAGSSGSPPDGLKAGKFVFSPYIWTTFQLDDNVFRSSNPTEDIVSTLGIGTEAEMPFRNSELALGVEAIKRAYQVNTFTRDVDVDLNADLVVNFSSFDTLTIRNNYYNGFTDVSRTDFDSGDAVFEGVPFRQWNHAIEMLRGVANQKGYYLRVSRSTLRYDEDDAASVAFYDYDGLSVSGEYRQPFANYKWLVLYGNLRNFDQYQPGEDEVDRKEDSGTLQVGLRGMLGGDSPFLLRVGYGTFDYLFPDEGEVKTQSSFAGLTMRASLGLAVGGRSAVDFQLDRRALPSNFDTSYTNTRFQTSFSRPFLRDAWLGLNLRYDNNVYNEPIEDVPSCNGGEPFTRHDRRYGVTANFDWGIANRLSYRMGVAFDSRDSTCELYTFNSTVLTFGVNAGW